MKNGTAGTVVSTEELAAAMEKYRVESSDAAGITQQVSQANEKLQETLN
jgi:hypothetical protein